MCFGIEKASLFCYNFRCHKEINRRTCLSHMAMNDNILNLENGQLYLNLSIPLDETYSSYIEALDALYSSLDYSLFCRREKRGRPFAIHPSKMMVLLIYSYMNGCFSSREIEKLMRRDCVCMRIVGMDRIPDHSTIDRFIRNSHDAITDIMRQSVMKLRELGELDGRTVFQDGTKIESAAGKYTFVWRTGCEKNLAKALMRVSAISSSYGLEADVTEKNVMAVMDSIEDLMQKRGIRFPSSCGRGHHLSQEQKDWKKIREEKEKIRDYIIWIRKMKETGRNSLSKTDEDATFMRMKEDHMRNGQLKAAYNMQNLVQNGYVVACGAFMDRNDYRTMIPMLEKLEKDGFSYDSYCADSGYDIKDNYEWLEKHGKKAYIKPQYHEENRKRKRRKNPSLKCNYSYDEGNDTFTCMRGHTLHHEEDLKDGRGVYVCRRGCKSCPLRKQCMLSTADKHDYKRLTIDIEAEKYRRKSEVLITSEKGIEMRINRSIQAEGSFSLLKAAFGYRRFRTHGIRNIETEWMILCMAGNALRYSVRLANGRAGTPFWFRIEQQAS